MLPWMARVVRGLEWYDLSLVNLGTAAFTLMVAKLYSPILAFEWYWYGLLSVLASTRPPIHYAAPGTSALSPNRTASPVATFL